MKDDSRRKKTRPVVQLHRAYMLFDPHRHTTLLDNSHQPQGPGRYLPQASGYTAV